MAAVSAKTRGGVLLALSIGFFALSFPLRLIDTVIRFRMTEERDEEGGWSLFSEDIWMSAGWRDYFQTPLGFVLTFAPLFSILAGLAFGVAAFRK